MSIFRPQLVGWLAARAAPGRMHLTVSHGIQIDCGHEGRYNLPQAVMQIEARYDAAFAASFAKQLAQLLPGTTPRSQRRSRNSCARVN